MIFHAARFYTIPFALPICRIRLRQNRIGRGLIDQGGVSGRLGSWRVIDQGGHVDHEAVLKWQACDLAGSLESLHETRQPAG